ncbi:MAG TPA: hypothetical protein VFW19_09325 [Allosphingosinicella sp.]|nr:hypothetical protein [Allosphingosinicella sp.]
MKMFDDRSSRIVGMFRLFGKFAGAMAAKFLFLKRPACGTTNG